MIEIRIHGRGGLGAVTTSQLIAIAAFYDKKYSQGFPAFGPERSGAPVISFVRIDDKKINRRSQIYNPDIVIVLDSSLIDVVDVTDGLKNNGIVIVNTNKDKLNIKGNYKVYKVDATEIATRIFNKNIVNTPILGAFAKITKLITLKSLKKAIEEKFDMKGKEIIKLNNKAVEEVYKITNENQ